MDHKYRERIYREYAEPIPDWIWRIDSEGVCTHSTAYGEELLGYPSDEVKGRSITAFMTAKDGADFIAQLDLAAECRAPIKNVMTPFVRADQVSKVLVTDITPILEGDRLTGFRCSSRDVVDRLVAGLLVSCRSLLEDVPIGIAVTRGEEMIYGNTELSVLSGYPLEELLGTGFWRFIHPGDVERVRDYSRRGLAGEYIPSRYEMRIITRSGMERNLALRAASIQYEGSPAYITCAVDVTYQRRAERAVSESEQMNRAVLDSLAARIAVLDARGVIVAVNEGWRRYARRNGDPSLAYTGVGVDYLNVCRQAQGEGSAGAHDVAAGLQSVLEGTASEFLIEYPCPSPTEEHWYLLHATPLAGETKGAVVSHIEITERKKAEELRRTLEKHLESQKRRFYRDTVLSVTSGKLEICEEPCMERVLASAQFEREVRDRSEIADARHEIAEFCREVGLSEERTDAFIEGVGEAINNAVKHAGSGRVYAGTAESGVWVAVEDHGKGIESLILPRALLRRGFSTETSLGLGYSIMLDEADRILLQTGPKGTIVALAKLLEEPAPDLALGRLLDTWETIQTW